MSAEVKKEIELEIAYILFIDIVGYSKLVTHEQRRLIELLNQIVRQSEHFRAAEAKHRLITVPTGDGMALVFYNTPEAPVQCAIEISGAAAQHPELKLRMGIHSGPVSGVVDLSGRANIAGAGINIAQRVMDCGDAGHVLVSKHMAEDLEQYGQWKRHLHDLGEIEVKHGVRVAVANLYTEELGNPEVPQKFLRARHKPAAAPVVREKKSRAWMIPTALVLVAALLTGGVLLFRRSGSPAAPAVPEKSVAVLPFANLSEDKANAYFTDGIQDEILTNLARIADLKVISRTSVLGYRDPAGRNLRKIGQELGVAHLVEGSVQRANSRVRVNAQLIDAHNDAHLWAQTYDRNLSDVFAIQSEIAKAIADQLQAKLSPQEQAAISSRPTGDTQAYDLYLQAKELVHNALFAENLAAENYSAAVNLLEKAVARDPNFALAYCLLAEAHLSLHWRWERALGSRERARRALEAAQRLAPEAGETRLTEALYFYWGERDYGRALEVLETAARILPNSAVVFGLSARIERRLGRWAETTRHFYKACELDPRSSELRVGLIGNAELVRNYREMKRLADAAIADFPEKADYFRSLKVDAALDSGDLEAARATLRSFSVPDSVWEFWMAAMWERNYQEADRLLQVWRQNYPGDEELYPPSFLGMITARAANEPEKMRAMSTAAREHFASLVAQRTGQPQLLSRLAIVDAALGRKEEALQESRRAVALRPISQDAVEGPNLLENLALVCCWTGDRECAIEQLSNATKVPGGGPTYGALKFDPRWDELRPDPRFEQIVVSLAPNETK